MKRGKKSHNTKQLFKIKSISRFLERLQSLLELLHPHLKKDNKTTKAKSCTLILEAYLHTENR